MGELPVPGTLTCQFIRYSGALKLDKSDPFYISKTPVHFSRTVNLREYA